MAPAIAGIDEVGRGPLAGPVVAAAVILPRDFDRTGLADSKSLTPARRRVLAQRILHGAQTGLAFVPAAEIDRCNIHAATLLAMRRALACLAAPPDRALIDGRFVPEDLPCPAEALVGGDAREPAIAAASIIAKVARDRMMAEAARRFPGYGFEDHAGYPTPAHRAALRRLGPCPIHRLSFGPCRAAS
ncbi:MAG: ribonuclease HII [Hyphomicrobiales bacterium]|uniref:ribonuclease HII n=1 Tax=Rhabdaerophilum calidifontis TaxID=2604328 RepID=UPI00123C0564|nr:ribonuclease HII [Rhabdaerophilum calidifontis]MCA1953507.1 ribonuclease HII [Hyphomicrobiales bacterium]MCA1999632.1 ribonuclease HII [Hyphomicrobiales bacterium]